MAIQIDTTTLPGKTIIFDDENGGVAIDYSDQLERIAVSLERIAGEDSTLGLERLVNQLESIATTLQRVSGEDSTLGLERLVNQLESISTTLQRISGESSNVGLERLANISEEIKNLASGPGIRTITPYEWVTLLSTYKFLIEENKLFDSDRQLSQAEQAEILAKINDYISKVDQFLPPKF